MPGSDGSVRRSNYTTTFCQHDPEFCYKKNMNFLHYLLNATFASSLTLSGVSIYTLTALSVDRLLALLLGLRYRQVVTLRRVFAAICFFLVNEHFIWLYLLLLETSCCLHHRCSYWNTLSTHLVVLCSTEPT